VTHLLVYPPDPDALACHQRPDGTWQLDVIFTGAYPSDFLGWVFKMRPGGRAFWSDAALLTTLPTTLTSIILDNMPQGEQTLMVKMKNKNGVESVNFGQAVAQIGDPILDNVVYISDWMSGDGPELTNGTMDDGHAVADADSSGLFWQPNGLSPAWGLTGSAIFWTRGMYKEMTAAVSTSWGFTGFCYIVTNVAGPFEVFYRLQHTPAYAWNKYTGPFAINSEMWDVKIVTAAGVEQGDISKFEAHIECTPVVEHFTVEIDSAGTRVPATKTFNAITSCQATLQVSVSYPAVRVTFSDRDNVLGPLWQGYDENNDPADAMADITYQGY
jgi:hypothetical protein